MANKTITFDSVNIGVTTNKVTVNRINLATNDSGDWNIGVDFNISSPTRNVGNNPTVSIAERHMMSSTLTVKRAEIATAADIAEEEVRTTLTLQETETYVTQIALQKLFAACGINAQNVVIT